MSHCTEVYVYEISPGRVEEFLSVKDQLITEATGADCLSGATLVSDDCAAS